MQIEDLIIQKMLDEKKTTTIRMLNGLKTSRPTPHSILAEEIYSYQKNPFNEAQTISALLKMWTEERITSFETRKNGNLVTWWALK